LRSGVDSLISGSGADEDVLIRAPAEQLDVALDLIRREHDEIDDRVEAFVAESALHARRVRDVDLECAGTGRYWAVRGVRAPQQGELDTALERQRRTRRADDARTTDE
jgi:hypothetical protein